MKNILGLDLGTNSIGWALIQRSPNGAEGKIISAGSRIIPMAQDTLSRFDNGQSFSQTAERTRFRSIRRLRERHLLRRARLHRVLHLLDFLPKHYSAQLDFKKHYGQFLPETEPKFPYSWNEAGKKYDFIFKHTFEEMMEDFYIHQPQLLDGQKQVTYDWTIYYLRKKALSTKIEKEELAWLLLHFNQKRGYYQLREEAAVEEQTNKLTEFHSLKVKRVKAEAPKQGKDDPVYKITLENGWVYRRTSGVSLLNWKGKTKEFIVTTEVNDDQSPKKDKLGKVKRNFRSVDSETDWATIKRSTEERILKSGKTVGTYIYDTLLAMPNQKIKGKLINMIERKFYKTELAAILKMQQLFHPELKDMQLYHKCLTELYPHNEIHRNHIYQKDFIYLFLNDIIFYQRPLKSRQSQISNCSLESRVFMKGGKKERAPLKCIVRSHPLYQEFRLWQFLYPLKIYQKNHTVGGRLQADVEVTHEFIPSQEAFVSLFDWLNDKKEIDQKTLFKKYFKISNPDQYRWNYVQDKVYPCNETRAMIRYRLLKTEGVPNDFVNHSTIEELWHILYSVEDSHQVKKALSSFAVKRNLPENFAENMKKIPPFKREYGAYSTKAIKKLLPLMRKGKYWCAATIDSCTRQRIDEVICGVYDEGIAERMKESDIVLNQPADFKGLPLWLAVYVVYNKHLDDSEPLKWRHPDQIRLLPQHSLRNPIIEQLINETLLVVRDVWKYHGHSAEHFYDEVHLKLGTTMKHSNKSRERLAKKTAREEITNMRIKALLSEMLNDPMVENVKPYSPVQQQLLKVYEADVLHSATDIPDKILKISKLGKPAKTELNRYKQWLQDKYRSPYSGAVIPLNKLFTADYQLDQVIPQPLHFDHALSNKIICELEIAKDKGNRTAFEYIKNKRSRMIKGKKDKRIPLMTVEEYEHFVRDNYGNNRSKMKRLLMAHIPDISLKNNPHEHKYISQMITYLMSNVVREETEKDTISKKVILSNDSITSALKQHWGLNELWNEMISPRFRRLNEITESNLYGEWVEKEGRRVFRNSVPLEQQWGFSKKRIDHRQHALDAVVVACTSLNHINALNNHHEITPEIKALTKPWKAYTRDTKEVLQRLVISFKQSLRIINKSINYYQSWQKQPDGAFRKVWVKQTKGDNWAIRKPIHRDTFSGEIKLRFKKYISVGKAVDAWETIVDQELKHKIEERMALNFHRRKQIQYLANPNSKWSYTYVLGVEVYYWDLSNVASRVSVDESFSALKIKNIPDTAIQNIMLNHLEKYKEEKKDILTEHPELAFSPDGLEELNQNIVELNKGKQHQPIYKVRTYEAKGNKFQIGKRGNKKTKYAEAARGSNLFFAIYQEESGKRIFETIPLNIVIERQKLGLTPVPEINATSAALLFYLSPNDLVFLPLKKELKDLSMINFNRLTKDQARRIYKVVSFTNTQCFMIRHEVALPVVNKFEFSPLNKMERSAEGVMIKESCLKLKADRIGNISLLYCPVTTPETVAFPAIENILV